MKNSDEKKTVKKGKPAVCVYAISVIVMIGCIYHSYGLYSLLTREFAFLPEKYFSYTKIGLLCFNGFFGFIAFMPFINNVNKILQTVISAALAVLLALVSANLPGYKGQLERTFTSIPEEGELSINVYVKADSEYENIVDLEGKTIAIQTQLDSEYQQYALKVINREFSGEDAATVEYEDIYSQVEALYAGEVDAILLNQSYAEIVADNADFLSFNEDTRSIYTCIQKVSLSFDTSAVGDITTEPFVVMIGGNDSWSYSNIQETTQCGRTDVNMMVVVNPSTKQLLIVSIPRDSYVPLWGYESCMDKLTHTTVYSVSCWIDTIEKWLGVDINYFVRVNFSSLVNVVDALGGVDVDNPYYFESHAIVYRDENGKETRPYTKFEQGLIHLDGAQALGYCRERYYTLPDGTSISDYGRNQHQAIVIKALIDQATSVSTISHISDLLAAVEGTFLTDITMDQIYALVSMQLEDMATWDMFTCSIVGVSDQRTSYAMGQNSGVLYSVVVPSGSSVNQAKDMINKMLNNEKLEH